MPPLRGERCNWLIPPPAQLISGRGGNGSELSRSDRFFMLIAVGGENAQRAPLNLPIVLTIRLDGLMGKNGAGCRQRKRGLHALFHLSSSCDSLLCE